VDTDRVEGKSKELEGKAQQKWADVKDSAEDAWDDVKHPGEKIEEVEGRSDDDHTESSASR